ncbi:4-hydroxy-tetrahydrodipicolinate synthase [Lysinibacillus sp. 54212]|uniref:4-hydroxy-tetrahydrodipicolinate synthase n=1 Tax=Lysinibacillus sp. 54212 TaxID=3119829 RepID=UPI002FC65D26
MGILEWGKILTAMVTPFDKNGDVNLKQVENLAKHLYKGNTDGLVLWGTTAESPTLSQVEKENIFRVVKNVVGNKGSIIVSTGTNDTGITIENTKKAQELGADGVMVIVPYYNKPSQRGIYEHFKAVANSTDLPVLIYNVPGRTGTNMSIETIEQLAKINNIKAIKESTGDVSRVIDIRNVVPEDFLIYSGDDSLTIPFLSVGGDGVISVASHIVGQEMKAMIDLFLEGNLEQAIKVNSVLKPLMDAAFYDVNPVPIKIMLNKVGLDVGGVRLPLVMSAKDTENKILQSLETYLQIKVSN